MKYVQMVSILLCLAVGPVVQGQVPVDLEDDSRVVKYDLGIVEQIPEGKADTLIVYSASWCAPCIVMKPVWVAVRAQGYKIVVIDVDKPNKDVEKYEYQTQELVDLCMENRAERVPTTRWYNSQTKEFLDDEIVGATTIKKAKEHLWKTSLYKAYPLVPRL